MYSEVFVTPDNYVEGFNIVEAGGEFEDSFMHSNTVPYDSINCFLSVISDEEERIQQEVVNKAIQHAQIVAAQNGWNAVLNFDIELEEMGEWATIRTFCVHVYGYLCNISPAYY